VVHVEARPLSKSTPQLHIEEEGSGVLVRFGSNDYVLTNHHVIHHSTKNRIRIYLADGQMVQPIQIWGDPDTDVAVMSIHQPQLITARLGDSDRLEIGEFVLAIGSPFGLSQSVTRGIVSAKGRYDLDLGNGELKFMNFIQTDAAINPGNSGGPLVNLRGEVVGLNTAIASSGGGNEGIGFTIPINVAVQIARDLVQDMEPPRGFLGVKLDSQFTTDRARSLGLPSLIGTRVTAIEEDSPAKLADVHVDDIIIAYDGVRVERDDHLISLVKLTRIGEEISLVLFRDGQSLQKQVTIGDLRTRSISAP
jgi:serine protease Do